MFPGRAQDRYWVIIMSPFKKKIPSKERITRASAFCCPNSRGGHSQRQRSSSIRDKIKIHHTWRKDKGSYKSQRILYCWVRETWQRCPLREYLSTMSTSRGFFLLGSTERLPTRASPWQMVSTSSRYSTVCFQWVALDLGPAEDIHPLLRRLSPRSNQSRDPDKKSIGNKAFFPPSDEVNGASATCNVQSENWHEIDFGKLTQLSHEGFVHWNPS